MRAKGKSRKLKTKMAGETMEEPVCNKQRSESRQKLEKWLNKSMKIKMTDGRTLIGVFLCTDSDCNIIMGSCEEYLKPTEQLTKEEPRILGLAMIPGKHVISIEIDESPQAEDNGACFEGATLDSLETMPKPAS